MHPCLIDLPYILKRAIEKYTLNMTSRFLSPSECPRFQSQITKFMGQYGAHLGPIGPRWAPCWPQESCYRGCVTRLSLLQGAFWSLVAGLCVGLVRFILDFAFPATSCPNGTGIDRRPDIVKNFHFLYFSIFLFAFTGLMCIIISMMTRPIPEQYVRTYAYSYWGHILLIDLIHKSQNAPAPYPTMPHSEQKCAHFCSEWNTMGYGTRAFWDLCDWSIKHVHQSNLFSRIISRYIHTENGKLL